jgi:predicted nucleotidyltransferase
MITHEEITNAVAKTAVAYPIKNVSYFGSYADGCATKESDLDLLIEFDLPRVSLLTLSAIKIELEELLKIPVDVIRAPLPKDSLIEVEKVVQVFG